MTRHTSARRRCALLPLAFAILACGDDSGGDAADPAPTTTHAGTAADDSTSDDGSDATEATADEEPEPTDAPGRATVTHDDTRYEFVVIQCLRDAPSAMSDDLVAFQADGVSPETPAEVVEDLVGLVDDDTDVMAALAPALEHGPVLSVTRLDDGGDQVAIVTSSEPVVTTADPLDPAARFLEIDANGAAGSGPTDSGELRVDLSCP